MYLGFNFGFLFIYFPDRGLNEKFNEIFMFWAFRIVYKIQIFLLPTSIFGQKYYLIAFNKLILRSLFRISLLKY